MRPLPQRRATPVDVCRGAGMKLARIARSRSDVSVVGVDRVSAVASCRDRHGFGTWHAADLDAPPSPLAGVRGDVVVCVDVIKHVRCPDNVLCLIRNLLGRM